jgi:oligopeptide transport system permease protein
MLKRVLSLITTLWLVATLTFFLMRLLPGGPFDRERKVPEAVQKQLEARYHLNDPLWQQYTRYLGQLAHGDLGPSYQYPSRTVNTMLADAVPVSASLGGLAMLLGTTVGIAMGVWAACGLPAVIANALGSLSLSTPTYLFGGLLVLVFTLWLRWLPAATLLTPAHWVLPVLALSLLPFSFAYTLVRTAMENARGEWFIRIKTAYGFSNWVIITKHVLRIALLPLVSLIGPIMATVLTGSFAIETMFAIPGIGKQFVNAVVARDYTVVMGITLIYSVLLVVFNMLTDWVQTRLDPRLR